MEKELKPCPYCASDTCECFPVKDDMFQVACSECAMRGPRYPSREEAVFAWNALPRRLRWTKEKPTQNGWYWWRTGEDCNLRGIVSVCIETDIMVLAGSYKYLSQTTGEWAGPIPEPEES